MADPTPLDALVATLAAPGCSASITEGIRGGCCVGPVAFARGPDGRLKLNADAIHGGCLGRFVTFERIGPGDCRLTVNADVTITTPDRVRAAWAAFAGGACPAEVHALFTGEAQNQNPRLITVSGDGRGVPGDGALRVAQGPEDVQ